MTRLVTCGVPLVVVVMVLSMHHLRAADEPAQDAPSQTAASTAEIEQLAAQLGAERFTDRQAASDKLIALGKPTIAAVEKAAEGESLEATIRAIEVLKAFLDSPDEATRKPARESLERLSKCANPKAARRATDVLKAKQDEQAQSGVFPGGGIQVIGGGIQVGPGVNVRRMSVRNNNGVREITVEEGGRTIKISDGAQQPIKIEVTTKKGGKDSTEKFEAKDVEELKKKHPDAYKIYKDYAQNQANGAFQFQVQLGGAALPVAAAPIPADQQVRMAASFLRSMIRQVENLTKGDQVQKASPQVRDEMKKQIEEAQRQLADLEKRLQAPAEKPAEKNGKKPQEK